MQKLATGTWVNVLWKDCAPKVMLILSASTYSRVNHFYSVLDTETLTVYENVDQHQIHSVVDAPPLGQLAPKCTLDPKLRF